MRPVLKGAKPQGYAYDIDLTNNNTLNATLANQAYTLTFKTTTTTVYQATGTFTPTMWQMLVGVWLYVATVAANQITAPTNLQVLKNAKTKIEKRIGKVYKTANPFLGTNIGKFCVYCEQRIGEAIAVEHIVPKGDYPMFSIAWGNFVLGCTVCNGTANKGVDPTRVWMSSQGLTINNEWDYYGLIRFNYLWPDSAAEAYRALLPVLEYWDPAQFGGGWKTLDFRASVRFGTWTTEYNLNDRLVKAMIYLDNQDTTQLVERYVRVMLYTTDDLPQQASNTRALVGLNKDGKGTSGSTADTRLIDRTRAWFAALAVIDGLRGVQINQFDSKWNPIVSSVAPTAGYYSLWVRILDLLSWPDPANPFGQRLVNRFVADANVSAFPGTDTNYVP